MKGKTYDLKKLADSGKFDTTVSTRFFYDTQGYYDALTDFAADFKSDFGNYTAAFVVNSDEDRKIFLGDCFEARAEFVRLGMTALMEALAVLEDAAIQKNTKEFSDGQVKFDATLRICVDIIRGAVMPWRMST